MSGVRKDVRVSDGGEAQILTELSLQRQLQSTQ